MVTVKIKQQTQGAIGTLLKHRCPQGALKITFNFETIYRLINGTH